MKLGSRRTFPYLWLAMGWPELLAVKLASGGGGRDSPEWKKTTARAGSGGSTASNSTKGPPMPRPSSWSSSRGTGARRLDCGDHQSPLVEAMARGLPDRAFARLRVRGGGVEWCLARIRGEESYI